MERKSFSQQVPAATAEQTFWLGRALEAREAELARNAPVAEPRDSIRRPFGIEALINYGLSYSTPWRVRDLSLTGAFVEMETNAEQLPLGAYVEFVLRYRYKNQFVEHRIPATVTRNAPDGLALTFGRYDDKTYTDLANMLYAL